MQCFLLGTGGTMPMPGRALTSAALRVAGAVYLFDCGEGTQVPYKAAHVGVRSLRAVFITHLHADHCLGLPGMLMLRAQMEEPGPLTLIGPAGFQRFVRNVIGDLSCYINYPIHFLEIDPDPAPKEPEEIYRDENVRVLRAPLVHSVFCVGYRLEEHPRPGRFDIEKARRLEVVPGPDFGKLQRGESVRNSKGEDVRPEQVLGPSRRGRHMAFCTDTGPCPGLYRLLEDVDLAILEGMFLPEHAEEAASKRHLLVEKAARVAVRSRVRETVLAHFSPRYTLDDVARIDQLARAESSSIRAGRDGEQIDVPLPD